MSGEGGERCEFATVPDTHDRTWLALFLGPLSGFPRGPGSKWKEQGGITQSTDYAGGRFLSVLLFPGDNQALGVGLGLNGQPSALSIPAGQKT